MTIVNDDSRVINKLETSHTDNARVVIYDGHMFLVQAIVSSSSLLLWGTHRRTLYWTYSVP
jgi:hypothetical protein